MNTLKNLQKELQELADPERAAKQQRYFKASPGEYGEGDKFLGIRVPLLRRLADSYSNLSVEEMLKLLRSPWHEERFVALILLVNAHAQAETDKQKQIYNAYLNNTHYINNWDLVDCSAEHIVGPHQNTGQPGNLKQLASSDLVWERRIAIMSTFYFIKRDEFKPTLHISDFLLHDSHDLIHKAVGWMLREVGNRDQRIEENFLRSRYKVMPRTMLRYAIEQFPEPLRQRYLKDKIEHFDS